MHTSARVPAHIFAVITVGAEDCRAEEPMRAKLPYKDTGQLAVRYRAISRKINREEAKWDVACITSDNTYPRTYAQKGRQ